MKRSGFTMIELIFVIVILGILAAVAIPRLAGMQDDALVASEKSGIGAARSAVISIRGKALARGHDFNMTVLDKNRNEVNVTITSDTNTSDTNESNSTGKVRLTVTKYPIELSLSSDDNNPVPTQYNTIGDGNAMAIVLEPDGRDRYKTNKDSNNSNNSNIVGPATSAVEDPNAELHSGQYWLYDSHSGIFQIKKGTFQE